jgi:hypothetical protein
MQIKEVTQKRGTVLQFFRYKTYNREKKRAEVEYIGSMSKYGTAVPADLAAKLTEPGELEQLEAYLAEFAAASETRNRQYSVRSIAQNITEVADAINGGVSPTDAGKIYAAMKVLGAALKKAGHPAPKLLGRGRPKKGVAPAVNQTASLDL